MSERRHYCSWITWDSCGTQWLIGNWIIALSEMLYKFEIFHCVELLTVEEILYRTVRLNSNQGFFPKLRGCSGAYGGDIDVFYLNTSASSISFCTLLLQYCKVTNYVHMDHTSDCSGIFPCSACFSSCLQRNISIILGCYCGRTGWLGTIIHSLWMYSHWRGWGALLINRSRLLLNTSFSSHACFLESLQ